MICANCPKFDKEIGSCGELPSQLENEICLLRHLCYMMNELYYAIDEQNDEGEEWKP